MKKILLIILDGFGISENEAGNATKIANTPVLDNLMSAFPVAELEASGESVGLPNGINGNCDAGYMTIGTGRVLKQPFTLIDEKIKDKSFFENDTLLNLVEHVNSNNSTLHIIGLLSNGSAQSSLDHFYAVTALAKIKKIKNLVFHFITDGVDSNPQSSKEMINGFMEKISKFEIGTIGTVCGRYYAMDCDGNYERVKKAYDAIVYNIGNSFSDLDMCIDLHYKNGITDEYINPSIITKNTFINDNDGVIFMNYSTNSNRELISSFVSDDFNMFSTKKFKNVSFVSLFDVYNDVECAFYREPVLNSFGSYLASIDYKQARIAESQKYSCITYNFDGNSEFKDKNLYKILVPSVKVPRFDMKPEMSAVEVTKSIMAAMNEDIDFIVASYANPDILGHTGNLSACTKSLEVLDFCIGKVVEKANDNFYDVVITSDHGNCEYMKDGDNIITSNTSNKVPFVILNTNYKIKNEGTLADVVPTIIDMFEISKPEDMTGSSLIIRE